MSKRISVGYDFGDLTVQVGTAVNNNDVVNKGVMDTQIAQQDGALRTYTDDKKAEAIAYVDSKILGLGERVGVLNPATGLPTTGSGAAGAIDKNDYWTFTDDGTLLGQEVHKYEKLLAVVSNPNTVDNTGANTDWIIEHASHTIDHRHELTGITVPATIHEVLGEATLEVTEILANADVLVVNGITVTAGGNLDVTVNNTKPLQATAIKAILVADNAFNAQYAVADNLAGVLTITEKVDQASGANLAHDESGIVGGNVVVAQLVDSIAYDLGDVMIGHNLGYRFVQVTIAESSTGAQVDVQPVFVDANNLKLVNETDTAFVVDGVVSI